MNARELAEFETVARGLINKFAPGYSFQWSRATRTVGECLYKPKLIKLSKPLALLNSQDEMMLTIFHELAHAIVGYGVGHGPAWRAKCIELGGIGNRLNTRVTIPPDRWEAICVNGHRRTRMRRPSRELSCGRCSDSFDPGNVLEWVFAI